MRKRERERYNLELSKLRTASQTDNARILVLEQQLADLRVEIIALSKTYLTRIEVQSIQIALSDKIFDLTKQVQASMPRREAETRLDAMNKVTGSRLDDINKQIDDLRSSLAPTSDTPTPQAVVKPPIKRAPKKAL